ncbi:hypothetical protein BN1708_003402 [Verticillium longisporum]|uniref:Deacetylase sirtuin-type domain-containing protein n=1 Tax=Verticillium longisporum TaxID=100787 RepID=A0A0G4LGA6_VERLO|nr:hypothetical protein BN1708_003402 [Verticillium longisporum]
MRTTERANGQPASRTESPANTTMYHKKPQRRIGKRRVKGPKGVTVNTVEMATSRSGSLSRAQTETPSRTPTPTEISHDLGLRELEERAKDVRESCWTHDSLFEDAVDGIPSDTKFAADDPDACSPAEAYHLRQLLRTIGPREFCLRTVDSGRYTAKRLLTAFNIRAPAFLDGAPEEAYTSMLTLAFSRELAKRAKLPSHNSLDDAVALLTRSRNIMVITGAGISTSLGIPDFRSKKTGLYAQLEHMGLAVHDPQEVFDINVFRDDPTIFYTVAKDIIVNTDRYSPTHAFIAMLDRMGKLLTNYTQNIDNVEARAGINPDRIIQCHGSFATASCLECGYNCPGEDIFPAIHAKQIPRCPKCVAQLQAEREQQQQRRRRPGRPPKRGNAAKRPYAPRRRSGHDNRSDDSDVDDDIPQGGVMKPDITFFGEGLPDAFGRRLAGHDRDRVDLVLVIGTSLKVTPVSEIVSWLPPHVPQLCISLDPINHINFDIDLLGHCDVVVAELCRRAGWDLRHDMVPRGQAVDVHTEPGFEHRHRFTQVYPAAKRSESPVDLKRSS